MINRNYLFAEGSFKNCWEGIYTDGARRGEKCVGKEFKDNSTEFEARYFAEEMRVIRYTQTFVDNFNTAGVLRGLRVVLNTPTIWENDRTGKKMMIEPMIRGFDKWNSNSGWMPDRAGDRVKAIQALSHFSFHDSGGRYLLCDLQGGIKQEGYILTDPAIVSQVQGTFGPADLGAEGIAAFFRRHRCGRHCNPNWRLPTNAAGGNVAARVGTTMVRQAPARRRH